jgi:hypothetical protein
MCPLTTLEQFSAQKISHEEFLYMCTFLHKLAPYKNLPSTIRFPRNMHQDILEKELILNGTVTDCTRPLLFNLRMHFTLFFIVSRLPPLVCDWIAPTGSACTAIVFQFWLYSKQSCHGDSQRPELNADVSLKRIRNKAYMNLQVDVFIALEFSEHNDISSSSPFSHPHLLIRSRSSHCQLHDKIWSSDTSASLQSLPERKSGEFCHQPFSETRINNLP